MTYEMLFGKGKVQGAAVEYSISTTLSKFSTCLDLTCPPIFVITGGGCVKRKLLAQIEILQSALSAQMIRKKVTSHEKLLSQNIQLASSLLKYIRINEIAMPIIEAFEV